MLRCAMLILGIIGTFGVGLGTWKLYRINPEDPEFDLEIGMMAGVPAPGLRLYLKEQQKWLAVVFAGVVVQFVAVLLAAFGGE
jgi:hypothetical protein